MKKYFYSDGTNNFGPFTLEELKEKEISRETMIWFQELREWKKAETIQELNDLFALNNDEYNLLIEKGIKLIKNYYQLEKYNLEIEKILFKQ